MTDHKAEAEYNRQFNPSHSEDVGSSKTLRKFVDKKLVGKGGKPLSGFKTMKELMAIRAKVN